MITLLNSMSTASTMAPSKYKYHNPKVIEAAVNEVKAKRLSTRKAAIKFGLPPTTLSDKVAGRTPMVRLPPTLLNVEETRLVDWLLAMSRCGFGQTTDDIRLKAKAMLELWTGDTYNPRISPHQPGSTIFSSGTHSCH